MNDDLSHDQFLFSQDKDAGDAEHLAEAARAILALRRFRDSVLNDPGLFGEPSWNILLDLFEARARGASVSVSSACVGSGVPTTTALRYITAMVENGWVIRHPHPWDNRVSLLTLSDDATERMATILKRLRIRFDQG